MILIKLSEPGWEKMFVSERDVKRELYRHICNACRDDDNINEKSNIDDMLGTACGCEFMVER
jgi:hypothetical protein